MKQSSYVYNFTSEKELLDFAKEQYRHNNSFYMFNLSSLNEQYNKFVSLLPKVEPFYAIKCNPDNMMIRTLYDLGCGLDCASKGELDQAINVLHADPDRIIFANPCKLNDHIEYMKEMNVKMTTFDNINELLKIKKIYPGCEVILRIATNDYMSSVPLSDLHGALKNEWELLIKKCRSLNLNFIGVSFHVGSGSLDPNSFYESIKNSAFIFSLAEQYGYAPYLLDIGGGFPGINEDIKSVPFEKFAYKINDGLNDFFRERKNLRVIAEPGRYFANGCMHAFLKIISRKVFDTYKYNDNILHDIIKKYNINDESKGKEIAYDYYVNESTNILFSILLMEKDSVQFLHLLGEDNGNKYLSNVYGYTSSRKDVLLSNVMLPKLNIGDMVYFKNVGSYSSSLGIGTQMNGYSFNDKRFYYRLSSSVNNIVTL